MYFKGRKAIQLTEHPLHNPVHGGILWTIYLKVYNINRLFFILANYFYASLHCVWLFHCFHNNSGEFVNKVCYCAKSWAFYWRYSDFEPKMGYISGKAKHEGARITSFQLQFSLWCTNNKPGTQKCSIFECIIAIG